MLKYNHAFNENLDYPFHIHQILSDTTSVAVSLNKVHIGYYKPMISGYSFTKYYNIPSILELMVVGSRQTYTKAKENVYFKASNIRYIKNLAGAFLVLDLETNQYYWSTSSRTSFFFNPEYFSSRVLWMSIMKYVPIGTTTVDLWSEDIAKELFFSQVYTTTQTWSGQKAIADIEPITIDYFNLDTTGSSIDIEVDYFIDNLQNLVNGDIIKLDNGIEVLEITVENTYTKSIYEAETVTTRPITHVPIDIVNPNKKYIYSKGQSVGDKETIELTLDNNNLVFSIERVEE